MSVIAEPEKEFKPLLGTDEATIDDKGRLLVGKKKRDRLGEDFILAITENGVLAAYPQSSWKSVMDQIDRVPPINLGRQQYARLIMGSAEDEMNFDSQGRVTIPAKMREAGRLSTKVVLVGAYDKLEIWNRDDFEYYNRDPDGYGQERLGLIEKALDRMRAI